MYRTTFIINLELNTVSLVTALKKVFVYSIRRSYESTNWNGGAIS